MSYSSPYHAIGNNQSESSNKNIDENNQKDY